MEISLVSQNAFGYLQAWSFIQCHSPECVQNFTYAFPTSILWKHSGDFANTIDSMDVFRKWITPESIFTLFIADIYELSVFQKSSFPVKWIHPLFEVKALNDMLAWQNTNLIK
jgi:hypothetical protein